MDNYTSYKLGLVLGFLAVGAISLEISNKLIQRKETKLKKRK